LVAVEETPKPKPEAGLGVVGEKLAPKLAPKSELEPVAKAGVEVDPPKPPPVTEGVIGDAGIAETGAEEVGAAAAEVVAPLPKLNPEAAVGFGATFPKMKPAGEGTEVEGLDDVAELDEQQVLQKDSTQILQCQKAAQDALGAQITALHVSQVHTPYAKGELVRSFIACPAAHLSALASAISDAIFFFVVLSKASCATSVRWVKQATQANELFLFIALQPSHVHFFAFVLQAVHFEVLYEF